MVKHRNSRRSGNACMCHATAFDAQQRDYNVVVISDCTAATEKSLHEPFLRNIDHVIGDAATVAEVKQALTK